jgi:hypothetical protein
MIFHLLLKPALLLTLIFTLPIAAIRAQPYEDRVTPILIDDDCPSPCFMGIRPGVPLPCRLPNSEQKHLFCLMFLKRFRMFRGSGEQSWAIWIIV